ncbi:MAG: hypothetical protein HN701_05010 [Rhodospirillaceae bacterium]|nr:hypothetical protein [Rhodospirillaceae bacterium]
MVKRLEYPMGAGRAFIRLLSEQAAKEEGAVTFAHPKRDPWLNPDLSKKIGLVNLRH